jgi:CRP/FNR family transcriptional regulator
LEADPALSSRCLTVISEQTTIDRLQRTFGFLGDRSSDMFSRLISYGSKISLSEGRHICDEGSACTHLALITQGSARVYKLGENGKEITLYRIGPGESCILTASCILSAQPFPAFAVTETPVEAVVVPASEVNRWLAESSAWREYIFGLVARRLANIINVVEEVVFRRMDQRIAAFLLKNTDNQSTTLQATHQEIASDLGTSREVVSRIIKDLESSSLIHASRGAIAIIDRDGLKRKSLPS